MVEPYRDLTFPMVVKGSKKELMDALPSLHNSSLSMDSAHF